VHAVALRVRRGCGRRSANPAAVDAAAGPDAATGPDVAAGHAAAAIRAQRLVAMQKEKEVYKSTIKRWLNDPDVGEEPKFTPECTKCGVIGQLALYHLLNSAVQDF